MKGVGAGCKAGCYGLRATYFIIGPSWHEIAGTIARQDEKVRARTVGVARHSR